MRGLITFREDGKVVGKCENLITTAGKAVVLRYLAGMTKDYAGAMAVGLDGTAPVIGDIRLGLETAKVPVIMRSIDYTNQAITFKGSLDQGFAGQIFEMGLIPSYLNETSGTYSGGVLTSFAGTESWTVTTSGTVVQTEPISSAASRVGSAALAATLSTNSGWVQYETLKALDLGGYSSADQIAVGYTSATNRIASINITFTDALGYTASPTDAQTITHLAGDNIAQYNILKVAKSAYTLSNVAFDWSKIVKLTLRATGTAGAGTAPNGKGAFDFIAVIDTDSLNTDYLLVSRVASGLEISCTFQIAGDTVTFNNHNLMAGTPIMFKTITTTTGIVVNTVYYVVNPTASTFQVASAPGGAEINLATNNGVGVYYGPRLASKTAGKIMDIEYKLVFNL